MYATGYPATEDYALCYLAVGAVAGRLSARFSLVVAGSDAVTVAGRHGITVGIWRAVRHRFGW